MTRIGILTLFMPFPMVNVRNFDFDEYFQRNPFLKRYFLTSVIDVCFVDTNPPHENTTWYCDERVK